MTNPRALPTLAVLAALGVGGTALVTSGLPGSEASLVLTGSSSNSANPECKGVQNATCNGGEGGDPGGGSSGGGNVKEFGVSVGAVEGLWPGRTLELPVTYTNPHAFDIHVSGYTVEASVAAPMATACSASYLDVPEGTVSLDPRVSVPRKASMRSSVAVGLKASAPDGCQGVTFDVTVTAWAVKK